MSQFNTPASEAPPWWESTWALAKPEIVRPTLGMSFSGGERNQLFLNKKGKEFSTLSGVSGADDADDPRGFAYLDFDRDGFVDMALGSRSRPSFKLFRNNIGRGGSSNNNIGIRFVGGNRIGAASEQYSTRDGFGATVSMELGSSKILREHRAGEGWRTQNSSTMLIGLGDYEEVQRLLVRWPSGMQQVLENVPADTLLTVYENSAETSDGSGYEMRPYRVDTSAATRPLSSIDVGAEVDFPLPASEDAEFTMFTAMATWCAACKRELNNIQRLRDGFGAGQLAMFGVPIDPTDSLEMLEDYRQKRTPAYELISDLGLAKREEFKSYIRLALHTDVLPATVILRRDGTPVYAEAGTPTLSKMRELLDHADALTRRETWASSSLVPTEMLQDSSNSNRLLLGVGALTALAIVLGLARKGSKA